VLVTISNTNFTSASVIEYWDGNTWVSVATTFTAPDTVSGTIPASALGGTPIVVGTQASIISILLIIVIAIVVVVVILGAVLVYMKKRKRK
jgi:membrane protein DedA with SNARE-associated domain